MRVVERLDLGGAAVLCVALRHASLVFLQCAGHRLDCRFVMLRGACAIRRFGLRRGDYGERGDPPRRSMQADSHLTRSCRVGVAQAASAGRMLRNGVAFSKASATRNKVGSWNGLATSWMATG